MSNSNPSENALELLSKLADVEREIVKKAKDVVVGASDPFSGMIKFLHEHPENEKLEGPVVEAVLLESFGSFEKVPEIIQAIAFKVRTVIRESDVIKVTNEETIFRSLGKYKIRKTENMVFEVCYEKGELVLKNIKGLFGTDCGIELPLEKIQVKPPKLIATFKMGFTRPQKVLDL